MNRRTLLRAGGTLGLATLAGCSNLISTQPAGNPPVLDNRPDAVYYLTHVEGMDMVGMSESGDYRFGLMYSYPHRFWNVAGSDTTRTGIESGDDVHIMASVWDGETMQVLPDMDCRSPSGKRVTSSSRKSSIRCSHSGWEPTTARTPD
ncbi:MAG: hypothetical protein U5K28_08735 [Halobacteriales archaeon]|nr:hypothetical protein [Halobacteriales archaeon]